MSGKLSEYVKPLWDAAVELEPISSALSAYIEGHREERFKTMIEQLESNEIDFTDDVVQSDEFVHAVVVTTEAVLKTHREEKIQFLANLLSSSVEEDDYLQTSIDEFEELTRILDGLSYREIIILTILDEYEERYRQENGVDEIDQPVDYWDEMEDEVSGRLDLEEKEVSGILIGLNRTGCMRTFAGYGGKILGRLTPIWSKLKERAKIRIHEGNGSSHDG